MVQHLLLLHLINISTLVTNNIRANNITLGLDLVLQLSVSGDLILDSSNNKVHILQMQRLTISMTIEVVYILQVRILVHLLTAGGTWS